jgi:DNA-binding transcriptional MerR regulator
VLVTRYLEHSIPYRSLFMTGSLVRYRKHLLDAIAGLLVQIHKAGIYWGDCSLSNTLFRRDAGELQAYLVDAETAEIFPEGAPAHLRHQELDIMEENVDGELVALAASGLLSEGFPAHDTGAYIRLRYQNLWDEISQEEVVGPSESFRIQERIRALNALGFSVGGVEYYKAAQGELMRLRVLVTDRNFHRDQLFNLTGLEAEEKQARLMMNEIQELRAALSQANQRSTPLNVAAYHWLVNVYQPIIQRLQPLMKKDMSLAELYCQVLEHKWYLSEKARHDVGHNVAVDDYIQNFANELRG